jgi:coenzyme F420-reducing hydrogenase delta subunit
LIHRKGDLLRTDHRTREQRWWRTELVRAQGVVMKPEIVVYCCANSTVVPEEDTENLVAGDPASLKISRLPCSGRTDVLYLLHAIEEGAAMAMVVGCPEDQCQFLEGSRRARMRVRYANRLLAEAGLGDQRVRMFNIDPSDDQAFAAALKETIAKAREIGS